MQNLCAEIAFHWDLHYSSYATGLFLYPLETSKNLLFADVSRGCQKRPVLWNGLIMKFHSQLLATSRWNISRQITTFTCKISTSGKTCSSYGKYFHQLALKKNRQPVGVINILSRYNQWSQWSKNTWAVWRIQEDCNVWKTVIATVRILIKLPLSIFLENSFKIVFNSKFHIFISYFLRNWRKNKSEKMNILLRRSCKNLPKDITKYKDPFCRLCSDVLAVLTV